MKSPRIFSICFTLVIFLILVEAKQHKKHGKHHKNLATILSFNTPTGKYMSWNPPDEKPQEDDKATAESDDADDYLCENRECSPGQLCKYGACVCGGRDLCKDHYHPVCGSDGILYPSHCELHRTACVKQVHIHIVHSQKGCQEENEKDEVFGSGHHKHKPRKHQNKQNHVQQETKKHQKHVEKHANKPSTKKDLSFDKKEKKTEIGKKAHHKKHGMKAINKEELEKGTPHFVKFEADEHPQVKQKQEIKEKKMEIKKPVSFKDNKVTNILEQAKAEIEQVNVEIKIEHPKICSEKIYAAFKDKLLQFHCNRLGKDDCKETGFKSPFLANAMFSYYDKNFDKMLDQWELEYTQKKDKFEKLSENCGLTDMLKYDDNLKLDGLLDIDEFHLALGIPNVALVGPEVFTYTAKTGEQETVEFRCDIKGANFIIWKRNGVDLNAVQEPDIQVSETGMLIISPIDLHHAGNYTCHDKTYPSVTQTHFVKIRVAPSVQVTPATHFYHNGADVEIRCHAEGIPRPEVTWEVNESPIPFDPEGKHYVRKDKNSTLQIKSVDLQRDTGAYKCKATNSAGHAQDVSTVFVGDKHTKLVTPKNHEVFIAFHSSGYIVYKPDQCSELHTVKGNFKVFNDVDKNAVHTLCKPGEDCEWGDTVSVNNKYVYVSQPQLNRILVISSERWNPVEFIETDKVPVKLQYVEQFDQVWVLNWNSKILTERSKTIQVIREASSDTKHKAVYMKPDKKPNHPIQDFFLPQQSDIKHHFKYGYIVYRSETEMLKIDLEKLTIVKSVDLKDNECIPKSITFVPLGGQVMVQCEAYHGKIRQLVLDYITDSVMKTVAGSGVSYVTPDGRHYINVDNDNHVTVYKVSDEGEVKYSFESWPNVPLDDVAFFPSAHHGSYDFFASSQNGNQIWYIDLQSARTELIEGVGKGIDTGFTTLGGTKHPLASSGIFGEHLMVPAKNSVVIINGAQRKVLCEWTNVKDVSEIAWMKPKNW